jgi:hypothetical protein
MYSIYALLNSIKRVCVSSFAEKEFLQMNPQWVKVQELIGTDIISFDCEEKYLGYDGRAERSYSKGAVMPVFDFEYEKKDSDIRKYFAYNHLPENLQKVSKPFADAVNSIGQDSLESLYATMSAALPNNEEKEHCLLKLKKAIGGDILYNSTEQIRIILEAKDCAVRACIE